MNYEEALAYIHGTKKYNTKPGLTRIQNLLADMGNPEKKMHYVHVAGTNGKGSSTAMMASVLMHAGYKTGSFISPFLERFNERMQINGEPIPDGKLAEMTEKAKKHVDNIVAKGMVNPSEFELLTAIAFDYWASEKCDFVSLEVGMGGTYDATNVIECPEVAMIISISFDHMHYLGNTLTEIAGEKAGIIKEGGTVVCYAAQPAEALAVIKKTCEEKNARFIQPDKNAVEILEAGMFGSRIRYSGIETTVPLMGKHQVYNAIGVIEAARALREKGWNVSDEDISLGIAETKWVGRLEKVHEKPECIIDAAHNPDAVRVLSEAIDTLFSGKRLITVMGILADKDYAYCIPEIAKRSGIVVATTPTSGRALPAEKTAEIAALHCKEVYTEDSITKAVDKAFSLAGEGDLLLICGSLYVIGLAKTYIRENK